MTRTGSSTQSVAHSNGIYAGRCNQTLLIPWSGCTQSCISMDIPSLTHVLCCPTLDGHTASSKGLLHIQLASAGLQKSGASCINTSNVLRGSNIKKQNLLSVAGRGMTYAEEHLSIKLQLLEKRQALQNPNASTTNLHGVNQTLAMEGLVKS